MDGFKDSLNRFKKNQFLFEELVKRDFKQKYKRTVLGMMWSVLSPLFSLLVMRLVFTHFFGRNMEHYTTYLFCGNLIFSYFKESTTGGMNALMANAGIFSKINVPKYMFLLSKNISSLINFVLTLCVFFVFALFTLLLMYMSAIFYTVETFPATIQRIFLLNPVYCYIKYFRIITIDGNIPSFGFHMLCLFYAVVMVIIGGLIYKTKNHKFLYYV